MATRGNTMPKREGAFMATNTTADALHRIAEQLRQLGKGDVHEPGAVEFAAMCIRDGLTDCASALREIAEAIRDSGYSG